MRYGLQPSGSNLLVVLEGRLDTLEMEGEWWEGLEEELLDHYERHPAGQVCIDLSAVEYADSRSLFQLMRVIQPLRLEGSVSYLGPGPGIERLIDLGEAPFISPIEDGVPWEEAGGEDADDGGSLSLWGDTFVLLEQLLAEGREGEGEGEGEGEAEGLVSPAFDEEEVEVHDPGVAETEEDDDLAAAVEEALTVEFTVLDEEHQEEVEDEAGAGTDTETDPAAWTDPAAESAPAAEIDPEVPQHDPEDEAFEIDLEMERLYIDQESDERDQHPGEPGSITFRSSWKSLEPSDEVIANGPGSAGVHRLDPVELMLRSAGGSGWVEGAEPAALPHPHAEVEDEDEDECGDDSWAADPEEEIEISFSADFAAGERPPGSVAFPLEEVAETRAMEETEEQGQILRGVGSLLAQVGRLEEEKRQLEIERDGLRGVLERERAALIRLQEEPGESHDAALFGEGINPELSARILQSLGRWSWFTVLEAGPCDLGPLKGEWLLLLRTFASRGVVAPPEVIHLAEGLRELSARITGAVGALLESALGDDPGRRWRALLLVISTIVREGADGRRLRRALRTALLAALVEHAPGSRPTPGRVNVDLHATVGRLLKSGYYWVDDEEATEELGEEPLEDLCLWHAAVRLAGRERITGGAWRGALGRVLATCGPSDPARAGLARVTGAHSLYFPGTWVELTTGGIGPVLGATPGRPELPRVLILFRRRGIHGSPAHPELFPAEGETGASVLRVLEETRLAEVAALPGAEQARVTGQAQEHAMPPRFPERNAEEGTLEFEEGVSP